jgi:hypothetical protein
VRSGRKVSIVTGVRKSRLVADQKGRDKSGAARGVLATVPHTVHFSKQTPQRLDAAFFRLESGSEPVREWLRSLPKDERKVIGEDIAYV